MEAVKTIQMKCGQTYVLKLDDGNLIESGDVFLPSENAFGTRPFRFEDFGEASDKTKRVMTISTMVGCYFNCQFCASKNTFKKNLSLEEIVGQVDFMIEEGKKYGRSSNPNASNEFHVLFTRMGEPLANSENTIQAMKVLIARFPHIKIGLSTNGWESGLNELLKHTEILPHIMLQFSIHATDDAKRSELLGVKIDSASKQMDLLRISKYIKEFRKYNPRKVSLNYIILDTIEYDFSLLRTYFPIEDIYLRLSPLNITENSDSLHMKGLIQDADVIEKKPVSSTKLEKIIENIANTGYSYAYAPAIDEEIKNRAACGQALENLNM